MEKIMDIIYFGYEDDSTKLEKEFIDEDIPKHLNLKNKWKFIKKFKTKDDFDKFCQVLAEINQYQIIQYQIIQ